MDIMRPGAHENPSGITRQGGALRLGLSGRVMALTLLFALVAEILVYLPLIAAYRTSWLNDRLAQARAAALILEKAPPDALPRPLVEELLTTIDTSMIVLGIDQSRRLLALSDMPPMVELEIDLRNPMLGADILNAVNLLTRGENRTLRVVGAAPGGGEFVEIVINEAPLRAALIAYSLSMLKVSLLIAVIAALIVFGVLNALIVRPVKRLASLMARFRDQPEDVHSLIPPSTRGDEIGALEQALHGMQRSLQQHLRQRENLATLGLAVAKINHDLRNMLASAQLMADRLGALPGADVQRFVPKLLATLDRAISFCQSTLAYGKAQERAPVLEIMALLPLVEDVGMQLGLEPETSPRFTCSIAPGMLVEADPDHLHRVLTNLVRNARAALETAAPEAGGVITVVGRERAGRVELDVMDNGSGIPPRIRETLFQAFSGSGQRGSTGLGLAIAQDLMRAMGGAITLVEPPPTGFGAVFRLSLPGGAV